MSARECREVLVDGGDRRIIAAVRVCVCEPAFCTVDQCL
jgi:hypothetical protein